MLPSFSTNKGPPGLDGQMGPPGPRGPQVSNLRQDHKGHLSFVAIFSLHLI